MLPNLNLSHMDLNVNRKLKKIVFLFLVLLFPLALFGQKKQIAQANEYIKSHKNLDKAEKVLSGLLNDSVSRNNSKVWLLLHEALLGQYEQGNEKVYLKQKCDTVGLFSLASKLFRCDIAFDSLEMRLQENNRLKIKHRQKHAEYLHAIRPNLFNAGAFYIKKAEYRKAIDFFEQYIDCAKQPLFSFYQYAKKDALMPHAGYWAMYCGYKLGDADLIMRYAPLAEQDTSMLNFVRQYEASAFLIKKDTVQYVNALKKGFDKYPNFAYFFPRLMEYYVRNGELENAMKVADRALSIDSTSVLFRFAKSTVLLNSGKYDECIDLCKQLISERDTMADAYYNIGLAYFNQAISLDKVRQRSASTRKKLTKFYEQSLPYMEKVRQLEPDKKELWLYPLYTIYLNLNMGKEFDEIDKIKNEYRNHH